MFSPNAVSSHGHRLAAALLGLAVFLAAALRVDQPTWAADPSFVGVLALAVEKDVAQRLGIPDDVQTKLQALIDRRENEALEIVLSIKDLPPAEQTARLTPFVAESERLGLELLTVAQREKLQQMRLAREGMVALAEPGLAGALGLSDEQKARVKQLLDERAAHMTKGGESERRMFRAVYERQLAAVLSDTQRAAWEKMAGLSDAPAAPAAESTASPSANPASGGRQPTGDAATTTATPAAPAPSDTAKPEPPAPESKPAETAPQSAEMAKDSETAQPAPPTSLPAKVTSPTETTEPAPAAEVATDMRPGTAPVPADTEPVAEPSVATAPESPETETSKPAESAAPPAVAEPARTADGLRFNFEAAPWKDVLDWFAQQAGLSLAIETLPVGSFTYHDDRTYTVEDGLDLLNSYLLTKGYTLVRRERILMVIDVESEIPDPLVTLVTIDELDKRGRFELVKCLFPLAKMKAEDAVAMIKDYLGPYGRAIPFSKPRQILVTETAGKLRTIRDMIARVEDPEAGGMDSVLELNLQHVSSEEVLSIARPLLGIAEGQNSATDISLSVDLLGTRIFATGSADKLQLLKDIVQRIDKVQTETGEDTKEPEQPKLATYYIRSASPQLVLRVVQTLLADLPGVRLEVDEQSGKLIAWARPAEHRTIEETLLLLEGQSLKFEVIPLKRIDPELAVAAINKFFAASSSTSVAKDASGKTVPTASGTAGPIVDGDPIAMQLWVRGTDAQIADIKSLIEKLEGSATDQGEAANVRMIPLSGAAAQSALETLEQFWTRKNKIRMVTPSALTPSGIKLRTITPLDTEPTEDESGDDQPAEKGSAGWLKLPFPPAKKPVETGAPAGDSAPGNPPAGNSAQRAPRALFQFVSQPQPAEEKPADEPSLGGSGRVASESQPTRTEEPADGEPAEIRVAITPGGILIASEDPEALDAFEEMLRTVGGPTAVAGQREITVFYLKYAEADIARQLVEEIMGGRTSEGSGSSLLGSMASNLLGGGLVGSLIGGMMGGGGGEESTATTIQASGSVTIVSDPRLNALVVEANPTDLAYIENLLRIIDRESSITDIQTAGVTRLIPVVYGSADEVAGVVRQAFADRMAAGQGGGQQQPSPEDFLRALRGQRTNRENRQQRGEQAKMTVGVDQRNNALVVTAPEPLLQQVEALVRQIDQPGSTDTDVVSVVPIRVSDPQLVQRTLASIMGTTGGGTRTSSTSGTSGGTPSGPSSDDIRRRIEFFRGLQESGAFGRPGGGGPGFGAPGGGGPGFGAPGGGPPSSGGRSFGRGRGR